MQDALPMPENEPCNPVLEGLGQLSPRAAYRTEHGVLLRGKVEDALSWPEFGALNGHVQLIFTSPPFPLNRKKKYDNLQGQAYLDWLASLANPLGELLTPTGSVVIELGNAWEPGEPVMSTLALESLLAFKKAGGFNLCQQFICHNPARLPSPAQWVNVKRCRVTDSFTHVWWMSRTANPKADNRTVLQPYSDSMRQLLKTKKYNPGARPSEHNIGKTSFFTDNGGSIPSNVLRFANTAANDPYLAYCRAHDIQPHPARMPIGLPEFFIKFLTDEGDLVFDPFAGSNTTGSAAECLGRLWAGVEPMQDYIEGSKGRFHDLH